MDSGCRNHGVIYRVKREGQLPLLLAQHLGHVRIIAEAGIVTEETMQDFRPKHPAHTRYHRHEVQAREGVFGQRKPQGIFEFLKTSDQAGRHVPHADIGGDGTHTRVGKRQEPVLNGPYWITESASVMAMNSPRAMRMPILRELAFEALHHLLEALGDDRPSPTHPD